MALLSLDSGCEGDCILESECLRLNIPILPLDSSDTVPTQADGHSRLQIKGKAKFQCERDKIILYFDGYVTSNLQSRILCGASFLTRNKVVQELHNNKIVIQGKYHIMESSPMCPNPLPTVQVSHIKQDDKEFLRKIIIDDMVPKHLTERLNGIHQKHYKVFDGDISEGYNGCSGNFMVDFNFLNNVPPRPHLGCVPSYNRPEDNILLQAKIDQLEEMGVVAKAREINIIPRYASPCMLVKKNSIREIKSEDYENMPILNKLKYNRFVLCQDKLNEHIEKIPAKLNKLEDTLRIVGAHEFVITSDLTDSFWQRHVKRDKLPYFAFHSPFKGTYVFLRSCQGFLNQSEGLEEMVSCILSDFTSAGWCRVHADNIYVLGNTMEETISNWQRVLDSMLKNNLKLAPHKTFCFSKSMDLLGWIKSGRKLTPDPHRINTLINASVPKTVKDLRSFLGSYRTFYKCKRNMSSLLTNLEEFSANKPSSQKLEWTPHLLLDFENAKKEAETMDDLYTPKPTDQLILTSDYSKIGINATLWAHVNGNFLVVSHMSAKLGKNNDNLLPCEGETLAHYVAAKCPNFSTPIRASNLKTISLLDNKTVCEASKLLKKGKFSSSKLINHLLVSISELNLDFQHLSGKMGQNFVDDFGSRNPVTCDKGSETSCKICNFVRDCSDLAVGALSFLISTSDKAILGQVDVSQDTPRLINDVITGLKSVPLTNRQAMRYLQEKDPVLSRVKTLLLSGQAPGNKENVTIKRYFKSTFAITVATDGCLITKKKNKSRFIERELIVVPEGISTGLVYSLHLNLNHPSPTQLSRIIQTRFFFLNRDKLVQTVWDNCALCQAIKHIPEEIHEFEPNIIPEHPGKTFTVDIIKHAKKNILVAVENFSGFISTCIIDTEKSKDLIEGIIKTIFPIKSALSVVRVDQAPGFRKLMKDKVNISELGLELIPGEAKNKNALAIVDKKISELEKEMKKIAPSHNVITVKILAMATNTVNEKIRNQGMSAKEILFSRDQITSENLHIQDAVLAESIMDKRKENIIYSGRSKSSKGNQATSANAQKGQLVFLKHDGNKHQRRDLYLVTNVDPSNNTVTICKIINALSTYPANFQPHNYLYNVRQTDIYLAPCQPTILKPETMMALPLDGHSTLDDQSKLDEHWILDENSKVGENFILDKNQILNTVETNPNDSDIWIFEENPYNDEETDCDINDTDSNPGISFNHIQTDDENENLAANQNLIIDNLFDQTVSNPTTTPRPGDNIEFLDTVSRPPVIVKALVMPKRKSVQNRWPQYCTVKRNDYEHPLSLNLNNTRWRYLDNIQQIDGNYTLNDITPSPDGHDAIHEDPSIQECALDNEDYEHENLSTPQSFFIDDELSDQESVFGYDYIETLTTTLSNSLSDSHSPSAPSIPELDSRLITTLDLAIPSNGCLLQNRVYRLPLSIHHRRQLRSNSDSDLPQLVLSSPQGSYWRSRWTSFKRFWSRFNLGGNK